jgi:peptidoglycan/LPS O-acetylase OafA/YrhL
MQDGGTFKSRIDAKADASLLVPTGRIPSLDGLRALAIGLVVLGHLAGTHNFPVQADYLAGFYADAGVRLFFVLSGFLITTLLRRERGVSGDVSIKDFYIRRAYRILPAAYCYMLVAIAAGYASLTGKQIAIALLYLSSYSLGHPWALGHLWSLSIEEQFYFLWPAAMKRGGKFATQLAISVVILAPLARLFLQWTGHIRWMGSLPVIGDSIAIGCLLALGQTWTKRNQRFFSCRGFPVIWILTWLIPLLNAHSRNFSWIGSTFFYIGLAACMQNAMVVQYRILNARIPVWIGVISYSLYLWQQPFLNRTSSVWYAVFPANLGLAIMAAALSYYFIERPALRLRDRRGAGQLPDYRGLKTAKETA